MKNLFSLLMLLLFSVSSFSQVQGFNGKYEVLDPNVAGKIFHNRLSEKEKPKGSPYLQGKFTWAKVESVAQKTLMRYNVYADEFEFITPKGDTLILDKIADFNNIMFTVTSKNYRLVYYTNPVGKLTNGYLINLYLKGDVTLFKKENITYAEERPAKTSLEMTLPAKYVPADDTYFIQIKEGPIVEFPKNKKQLIKMFPAKKNEIEAFLKANEISFDEESSLFKLIDFVAAL